MLSLYYTDFTPSRGSTPNYQPRANTVMSNVFLPNNVHDSKSSEPSPTGRRKLSELLQEAMQNGPEENTDTATGEPDSSKNGEQQQPQSVAAAEKPVSESSTGCSTEPTPAREARSRKERAWYAGHCCLPTFVHSLTLEEDGGRQKTGPGPVAVWPRCCLQCAPSELYRLRYYLMPALNQNYCKESQVAESAISL
jgi:hypothetical protein